MAGMEGLGRLYNVAPIAAGAAVSMRDCSGYTFVCTGNDTFTLTLSPTFGGNYALANSALITRYYTNPQTNGTGVWTKVTQAAGSAVTISSGSVAFDVLASQLGPASPQVYLKVTQSSGGLVTAIAHDLEAARAPANLPKLSA